MPKNIKLKDIHFKTTEGNESIILAWIGTTLLGAINIFPTFVAVDYCFPRGVGYNWQYYQTREQAENYIQSRWDAFIDGISVPV